MQAHAQSPVALEQLQLAKRHSMLHLHGAAAAARKSGTRIGTKFTTAEMTRSAASLRTNCSRFLIFPSPLGSALAAAFSSLGAEECADARELQ